MRIPVKRDFHVESDNSESIERVMEYIVRLVALAKSMPTDGGTAKAV